MDTLPSGSDKTRVPPEPDAQDTDATVIGPSPLSSGTTPLQDADAPTMLIPLPSTEAATILSSAPAVGSSSGGTILLEVGTVLGGRYELLKLLGQGGMGAVYKATDREVDRSVALKVIRPEMAANPEILARFKQELLLSSQVTHRNVIRIYDLGEAQGVKFITMEFVEGENLHQMLKDRGKLGVAEAVDIMEQVTSGLAAAHREGIIHRDLKPANIMVDKNGRVVLMDFGLARTFSGDGMTQTGMMLGTMEYMSPEQAQGQDVKASSDVFTVGLMLYELLAGTTPFQADSAIASLLMRTTQRAAPLVNIDKNIPGTLSNIVVKCLEKDPAKRYQSAEHLDADLRAWQSGSGLKKVGATATRQRVDRARELPWLKIGAAAVVVVALAAAGTWYVVGKRAVAKDLAHGPVSVLIGDFQNHTGESVLDDTLEPMLGVAMEGASFINVYSRGDARKIAKRLSSDSNGLDEQSSRLVALDQGINAVIVGDISLRGDQYEISAVALDGHSGNVLAKTSLTIPSKQEIMKELPELTIPIRQALGDKMPASQQFEKVSGGFAATSLEVVHLDAQGVDEQFAGKFQEAFDSFKAAADKDPKFARAYSGMAAMAQNLGRPGEAAQYMKLAMANSDRMTERERFRNQGLYYMTTGDWENCVAQYNQLVTKYPADRVGQNNLAACYTQLRNAPKALEAAKHAVEIVPMGVSQRITLAFIESFASDFATSETEARKAIAMSPNAAQAYLVLGEALLGQGKLSDAADTYHHLETFGAAGTSTSQDGLADLAAYQGKYADAARILTLGAVADTAGKMTDNAARKYASLANIEELQGHQGPALAAIGKALAGSQATSTELLAAMVFVDAGDLAKAQKAEATLAAQTSSEPQAYSKIVLGMIALQKKDTKEAVAQMIAANKLMDTWIGRFELGRAYLAAGMFKEASSEFALCIQRRGEAIELFDDNVPTYSYFPAVYYFQGLAQEGLKDPAAATSYKAYLGIRGQSTDDPLVAEIHKRIGQ